MVLARVSAVFGRPSERAIAGYARKLRFDRRLVEIGLDLNLVHGAAAAGLASFYGAGGALTGINLELYKALLGRDDEYIEARFGMMKEMAQARGE